MAIPEDIRKKATKTWRNEVIRMIGDHPNLSYFEAAKDTDSIVSLCIKHPDTDNWMTKSELAPVFKAMTLDMSDKFPEEKELASKVMFTGQPVFISKE